MLQWRPPPPWTYRQHQLDLLGYWRERVITITYCWVRIVAFPKNHSWPKGLPPSLPLFLPSSFLSFFLGKYINLAFWILKQQESLFACITQHVNMCYSFVAMTGKWTCILILLSISATKVTHLLLYGFNTWTILLHMKYSFTIKISCGS